MMGNAVAPSPTTPQPNVAAKPVQTNKPPKLDQSKLSVLMQKWGKAKQTNQPLTLTPEEMEALDQVLGGDTQQPQQPQQTQQTSTPPVKTPTTPAI